MFGWFKKKPAREETEAFKMGQQASQAMTAAVDEFMESRFDPAFKAYLRVFDECLDGVYKDDAPPITIARIEYRVFMENVDRMQVDMVEEIQGVMHEWSVVADTIGSRDWFDKYISKIAADFCVKLKMTGLQHMIDRADTLKSWDDQWRRDNPQKATEFPIEE